MVLRGTQKDDDDDFEDAVSELTPLSAVADSFEELSALVKSKGFNHDLDLKTFCDACSHVSVLFGCLGIAFKFTELEYAIVLIALLVTNEMATPMVEDNFEDDHLSSMTTEDIIRASRLLDNEMRVLEVSFFSSIGCCFRIIYWLFAFCWVETNFLCALQVSLVKVQVESNFILNSKLSVEGPLRMREEYIEGVVESPKIKEESIPQQLKGSFDQTNSTVQQLPVSIRDSAMSGFKVPLGGTFQRLFLISYLDDKILDVHVALQKLEGGGSVHDAKAFCGTNILFQRFLVEHVKSVLARADYGSMRKKDYQVYQNISIVVFMFMEL